MKTNNTAGNGGVVLGRDTNIWQFDFAAQLRLVNALFGSLQKITAQQLGLDPVLMTAANSAGGAMGKMVDAQSICVATATTNQVGNESFIFLDPVLMLRCLALALGAIVGVIVMIYAYLPWTKALVPHGVKLLSQ